MGKVQVMNDELRDRILSAPETILDDRDVMRALIEANQRSMGDNIVDLRGIAMERLEARLDRLEDTHRSVIAAAYDNLAGTNLMHRAVLRMLDPTDFEGFLHNLAGDVAAILRVDVLRLVLESVTAAEEGLAHRLRDALTVVEPGQIAEQMGKLQPVVLRQAPQGGAKLIFGPAGTALRSEALVRLDLGPGRLPAMVALGSKDSQQFRPHQGVDLLTFFGAVLERTLRRWLA